MAESLSAGNFEKIWHQTAFDPDWLFVGVLPSKSGRMPVDWKSRNNRPCKPCNLTSVLWLRAILRPSIRVATPELSIWVTADRSRISTLQLGPCNVVRSSARRAGEESISIRPQIRATVPFSPVTTSISGLSIRSILLPSNGIPSFLPRCRGVVQHGLLRLRC